PYTTEIKTLKTQISREKQENTLKEIQNKLEERNDNFLQNPKIFFRNVLEKHTNNINLDRILSDNTLTTQPTEIKQALQSHFQDYFKELPYTPIEENSKFYELYKPHPENELFFVNLFSEITLEEWN